MTKNQYILVINCGSSSLKFALICPSSSKLILSGLAQCLGDNDANITIKYNSKKNSSPLPAPYQHSQALHALIQFLHTESLAKSIAAIGHRVVHGGEKYHLPTKIDDEVMTTLKDLCSLAPIHNPANIVGIEASLSAFEQLPQVAVFDTAFHQSMSEMAYRYPLPASLYEQHGIRKYGFHGTSHYFVSRQAAKMLNKPIECTDVITAHLGNGCSVTSVSQGKSVDTSMGFTPLSGVAMGTRSGDLDPGVILHLINQLGYSPQTIDKLLNKESGLMGLSKISNDCRTLEQEALENNNTQARLALDVFSFTIAKSILAMTASLTKLDAVVFTGGIGENSSYVRTCVTKHLKLLGLSIEENLNIQARFGQQLNIAQQNSPAILVIPTDEEGVIAEQTYQLIQG
ncbi:acetate kinase [Thalassotalea sp. M1531]|uniref:Acetate kinase n=1 Tax=Thalassotalea algicola TaxID=2716224 RepID=A0A7Y0LE14_9GAMM|nr:acetate kinase [Thalassotalea algicola]NMP32468.1 acetate kinase [Thalassotalea algicola]